MCLERVWRVDQRVRGVGRERKIPGWPGWGVSFFWFHDDTFYRILWIISLVDVGQCRSNHAILCDSLFCVLMVVLPFAFRDVEISQQVTMLGRVDVHSVKQSVRIYFSKYEVTNIKALWLEDVAGQWMWCGTLKSNIFYVCSYIHVEGLFSFFLLFVSYFIRDSSFQS